MEAFAEHGTMTSPGKHAHAIDALPSDISSLLNSVRGLFVHSDFLDIYGLVESEHFSHSRETLPLEKRLDQVFQRSSQPLTIARPVNCREVGTCRDYAVMACGMLRQKSVPARVRCGFGRYFSPGRFEDHWICEYWRANEKRWARADAQLDARHCDHLGITFDTSDIPDGEFVTANEAWDLIRNQSVAPELFGHGDAVGAWFVWVNLARDYLSLRGQETSPWDEWRTAIGREPEFNTIHQVSCDSIAEYIRSLEQRRLVKDSLPDFQPFWLVSAGKVNVS